MEDQLKSVLSISPVGTILLTDLQHDQRMEALSGRLNEYECRLKHLRKQFQENIIEKMVIKYGFVLHYRTIRLLKYDFPFPLQEK